MPESAQVARSESVRRGIPGLASVVCLSYERRAYVLDVLAAVARQDYPHVEVILVDNASKDGTADAVESLFPEIQLIRCPQNFGMVAYNLGMANARGEVVFVIDDDGYPASTTWISDSLARFVANPRLGALACTIRMADTGRVAYDSPQFIPEGDDFLGGYLTSAYNGTGAALRAEALHNSGYYPFHFFRSWLELSLCTKLVDLGWEVRYFPDLEIWHRRVSNSVNRPATYHGLRNYFWYVWSFYPSDSAIHETARYAAFCMKLILRRQMPIGLLLRAWRDAVMGWGGISATRHPVSRTTVEYLHRVRQCGNDYGLVPAQRCFDLDGGYKA